MGARTSDNSATNYYKVLEGKFARKVAHDEHGAVAKEYDGKTVFYLKFDILSGFLRGITEKEVEFNGTAIKMIEILLVDLAEERSVLSIPKDSGVLNRMLNKLQLADLSKEIEFEAYRISRDGTYKNYVDVIQDGSKLPSAYTKENMRDCPVWETTEYKGKILYDNTKQVNFLIGNLVTKLKSISAGPAPEPKERHPDITNNRAPEPNPLNSNLNDEEDLPF